MKPARFHSEAETELIEEAGYYESCSPGMGEHFIQEIQAAVALVAEYPGVGTVYKYGTRRVFPKKFPFSVVYLERQNSLVVLAIAPFARKPGYWRKRMRNGA